VTSDHDYAFWLPNMVSWSPGMVTKSINVCHVNMTLPVMSLGYITYDWLDDRLYSPVVVDIKIFLNS
jgi:hypothetical protein